MFIRVQRSKTDKCEILINSCYIKEVYNENNDCYHGYLIIIMDDGSTYYKEYEKDATFEDPLDAFQHLVRH